MTARDIINIDIGIGIFNINISVKQFQWSYMTPHDTFITDVFLELELWATYMCNIKTFISYQITHMKLFNGDFDIHILNIDVDNKDFQLYKLKRELLRAFSNFRDVSVDS